MADSTATAIKNWEGGKEREKKTFTKPTVKNQHYYSQEQKEAVKRLYLHDHQCQCENQQDGQFVQHKSGEDVKTFSNKHTT